MQVNCSPPGNITIRVLEYRPSGGGYLKLTFLNVAGFIGNVLVGQSQANVRTCSTCLSVPATLSRLHASHQMPSLRVQKSLCLDTYMWCSCSSQSWLPQHTQHTHQCYLSAAARLAENVSSIPQAWHLLLTLSFSSWCMTRGCNADKHATTALDALTAGCRPSQHR